MFVGLCSAEYEDYSAIFKASLEEFGKSCFPLVGLKMFLVESPLNYEEADFERLSWEWETFHPHSL